MDLNAPISSIMTSDLITVEPDDKLSAVKDVFDNNRIHHLPVADEGELKGLISKSDLFHFFRGMQKSEYDKMLEKSRLNNYRAQDIMTKGLAVLEPGERISVALEIFKENLFHAIPVVEDGKLVGILTSFDIIRKLADSDG